MLPSSQAVPSAYLRRFHRWTRVSVGASALFLVATATTAADAQEAVPASAADPAAPAPARKTFGVFIDPLNFLLHQYGAQVSYSPSPLLAVNVGALFSPVELSRDPLSNEKRSLNILLGRVGVQLFPMQRRSFGGFYVQPRAAYLYGSVAESQTYGKATASGYEVSGVVGYQWVWDVGFAIRLGGGVGYASIDAEVKSKSPPIQTAKASGSGVIPALEFALGWVF